MADDRGDGAAPSKAVPRRGTEIGERTPLFAYDRDSAMLRDDVCGRRRVSSGLTLHPSARTARVMPPFFVPLFFSFFFFFLFFFSLLLETSSLRSHSNR